MTVRAESGYSHLFLSAQCSQAIQFRTRKGSAFDASVVDVNVAVWCDTLRLSSDHDDDGMQALWERAAIVRRRHLFRARKKGNLIDSTIQC